MKKNFQLIANKLLSCSIIIIFIIKNVFGDKRLIYDPTSYRITMKDQQLAVASITSLDDYLYIAQGKAGVNIYDIKDLNNIKLLSTLLPQTLSDGIEPRARRLCFLEDETKLIVAYESYGVIVYDISNKQEDPIFIFRKELYTNVVSSIGTTIILGTQKELYLLSKDDNYKIPENDPNKIFPMNAFIRNIRVFVKASKPYLFVTLGEQGLKIVDIQGQKEIPYCCKISKSETFDVAVDDNVNYAFAALTIYGIDLFDLTKLGQPSYVDGDFKKTQIMENNNYYYSIFYKNSHIYASSYGRGVEIYQVDRDKKTNDLILQLIQEIILVGDTTTIYTDKNEQRLFSTKNSVLHINQRTKDENIDDMPNLQNTHQQIRYAINNNLVNVAWDSILLDDHFIIAPYASLYIFDFESFDRFKNNSYRLSFLNDEKPQKSEKVPETDTIKDTPNAYIEGLEVYREEGQDNGLLFIGRTQKGLYVYDLIKVPAKPGPPEVPLHYELNFKVVYPQNQANFIVNDISLDNISANEMNVYCALGQFGVQILRYNKNQDFNLIQSFTLDQDYLNSRIVKVLSSKNANYLLCGARRYGILIYDISSLQAKMSDIIPLKNDPIFKIRTDGGEDFEFSSDEKYLFVADFLSGFSIVQLFYDQNGKMSGPPKLLKRVLLDGQALMIQLLKGENYVLVGQTGNKLISLIDVTHKDNPKLVQSMAPENEVMQSFVIKETDKTGKQIIMPTTRGLRIYNMTNPFDLNYEINNQENQKKSFLNDVFMVGEKLTIKLIPLKFSQVYQMNQQLYIIQSSNVVNSPNYFSYNPDANQITFTVNKENVPTQYSYTKTADNQGVLVIIVKFLFKVDYKTFQDQGFSETKSIQIVSDGQQRGFIDSDFYPTDMVPSLRLWTSDNKYADSNVPNISDASKVKYLIESIFNNKIVYYPIRITVQGSILFDNNEKNNLDKKILSTLSNNVKITLTNLDDKIGCFIKKQYDQVQTEISDNKQIISISGDPTFVTEALQKLRYQPYLPKDVADTTQLDDNMKNSEVNVLIQDSINKQIEKNINLKLQEIKFINYNERPSSSQKDFLQTQFEQQQEFSNSFIIHQLNNQQFKQS